VKLAIDNIYLQKGIGNGSHALIPNVLKHVMHMEILKELTIFCLVLTGTS